MIETRITDAVFNVRINHGKVGALDGQALADLSAALRRARDDESVGAAVITGSGAVFSAGANLKWLLAQDRIPGSEFLLELDRVFEEVFSFPKPVIAALNGPAIGGGCILAMACDYRIAIAGQVRMGVPELKVGAPLPVSGYEIMRCSLSPSRFQHWLYGAELWDTDELLAGGIVHELVVPERLAERAQEFAMQMAGYPGGTFLLNKRMLRDPVVEQMNVKREQYAAELEREWSDPALPQRMERYISGMSR